MSSSSFAGFCAQVFAQVTNAVNAVPGTPDASAAPQGGPPAWTTSLYMIVFMAMIYFAFLRPQMQNKKKAEETVKSAKTGDKVVTSSGIHGVITNVKESTVIVRVADNVKLEIEKSHIDKITRAEADTEKVVTAKVS